MLSASTIAGTLSGSDQNGLSAALETGSVEKQNVKTYYIASTQAPGMGTKSKPFTITRLDEALATIRGNHATSPKTPVRIIVGAGDAFTRGVIPLENWWISGAGEQTRIALVDVGRDGFHAPDNYVVSSAWHPKDGEAPKGPSWLESFRLENLTLEANWPNQSASTQVNQKFGCVHVQSVKTTIRNVKAVGWGSNGLNLASSEAFPITAVTLRRSDAAILIEGCTVEDQHQHEGGYATGINVVTIQDQGKAGGDVLSWEIRRKACAIVKRNVCRGIYGHGLGCGWADGVLFQDNIVENSKTGFNGDTGRIRDIEFRGNRFLGCNQGIWLGNDTSGEFSDVRIRDNLFHLTEPWVNRFLHPARTEYSYAVRLTGKTTREVTLNNNTITSWPALRRITGRYGIGWCLGAEEPVIAGNVFSGIPDEIAVNVPVYLA